MTKNVRTVQIKLFVQNLAQAKKKTQTVKEINYTEKIFTRDVKLDR